MEPKHKINENMHMYQKQKISTHNPVQVLYREGHLDGNSCVHCTNEQIIWLYCVESPQYSIQLKALGYLCPSCLVPALDEA